LLFINKYLLFIPILFISDLFISDFMICERCGAEIYKYSTCRYCRRKVCNNCV